MGLISESKMNPLLSEYTVVESHAAVMNMAKQISKEN